jgi:hypothetical protein
MNGLPPINRCEVSNCFYNRSQMCHAPAINVGDQHPACDTFVAHSNHIGRQDVGMVGACHIDHCRWNKDLTCSAQSINVMPHAGHADCATYAKV